MSLVAKISVILLTIFLIWNLVHALRANPESLSKANLSKSFSTMGMLALALIGFITLCVLYLRSL